MADTVEPGARNGYWTDARMRIWSGLSPEQRDYDRYVGVYPPGQGGYETEGARKAATSLQEDRYAYAHSCRCHINPPCSHCTDCRDCTSSEEAQESRLVSSPDGDSR